jgi:hypothetical protein
MSEIKKIDYCEIHLKNGHITISSDLTFIEMSLQTAQQ